MPGGRFAPSGAPAWRESRFNACGGEGIDAVVGDGVRPAVTPSTLREHDRQVREIARLSPATLPARFGTTVSDPVESLRQLETRSAELVSALQQVRDREQMTLRIFGARTAPAKNEALRLARHGVAQGPGGSSSLPGLDSLRKLLGGQLAAERVERGHPGSELVATVFHLIARGTGSAYLDAVSRWHHPDLRAVASGPWPAYAFVNEGLSLNPDLVAMKIAEVEALRKELEERSASSPRWNANPEDVQKSLARLVLALVEFLRELMERQAIRRMEEGTITDKETESIGQALMKLEETVDEMAGRFGLTRAELNLDLGPLGRLR